jgi:hypothetical protein
MASVISWLVSGVYIHGRVVQGRFYESEPVLQVAFWSASHRILRASGARGLGWTLVVCLQVLLLLLQEKILHLFYTSMMAM